MRLYNRTVLAALACLAALPAAAQEVVLLRLPAEDRVAFRGIANFDGVGPASNAPIVPAPNLAGALVGLLTHAVIMDSVRRNQESRTQGTADNVLAPYRDTLDMLTHRELMQDAAARMTAPGSKRVVEAGDKPATGLIVESLPVFSMTQDTLALVLDNTIVVRRTGDAEVKSFQVVVRIVSAPQTTANWSDDGGRPLKEQSAALLAESFDTALSAIARQSHPDAPQRTVRYRQGKEERMERAQVLAERCDRLLLKNLRGWLMSVPVQCEPQAAPASK